MTDVDAIRWMASEHDLEFVDLERYGVDPAAGEILPVDLARRHHMVAIKRRFGTPVIATANPDDLYAKDSVRASIGRDFISVVASPDQIDAYIERLFGPEPGHQEQEGAIPGPLSTEPEDTTADTALAEMPAATETDAGLYVDLVFDAPAPDAPEAEGAVAEGPGPVGPGKGKRAKEDRKRKKSEPESETLETSDWQEFAPDSPMPAGAAALPADGLTTEALTTDALTTEALTTEALTTEAPSTDDASVADARGPGPFEQSSTTVDPEVDVGSNSGEDPLAEIIPEPGEHADPGILEPATSILPSFGSDWIESDAPMIPNPLDSGVDQLAELALSLQSEERSSGGDETVMAADLVDEAVATYQEQLGDELRLGGDPIDAPNGTAMFPPLAKALVDGERVPIENMEAVLEEHYQTGQSIARILTAQKLVSEADLMWGMAQELGLEFVDLDTVGVDLSEAGTIPEATADTTT